MKEEDKRKILNIFYDKPGNDLSRPQKSTSQLQLGNDSSITLLPCFICEYAIDRLFLRQWVYCVAN